MLSVVENSSHMKAEVGWSNKRGSFRYLSENALQTLTSEKHGIFKAISLSEQLKGTNMHFYILQVRLVQCCPV